MFIVKRVIENERETLYEVNDIDAVGERRGHVVPVINLTLTNGDYPHFSAHPRNDQIFYIMNNAGKTVETYIIVSEEHAKEIQDRKAEEAKQQ